MDSAYHINRDVVVRVVCLGVEVPNNLGRLIDGLDLNRRRRDGIVQVFEALGDRGGLAGHSEDVLSHRWILSVGSSRTIVSWGKGRLRQGLREAPSGMPDSARPNFARPS